MPSPPTGGGGGLPIGTLVPLISPATLDSLRRLNQRAMPDSATIYTQSEADDSDYGSDTAETARSSDVPCRFSTLSGQELVRAQQLAAEATVQVTFAYGTEVGSSDRIEVTDAESGALYNLQVSYIKAGSYVAGTAVYCQELSA